MVKDGNQQEDAWYNAREDPFWIFSGSCLTCSPILHLPPYFLPLFKFQGPPTSLQKCQETFYRSDMWKCYFSCFFTSRVRGNVYKKAKSFLCLPMSFWTCMQEEPRKDRQLSQKKKLIHFSVLSTDCCFTTHTQKVWEAKNLRRRFLMLLLLDYFVWHFTSEACKISWGGWGDFFFLYYLKHFDPSWVHWLHQSEDSLVCDRSLVGLHEVLLFTPPNLRMTCNVHFCALCSCAAAEGHHVQTN